MGNEPVTRADTDRCDRARNDQPPLIYGEALRPARCLVFKQLSPKNAEKRDICLAGRRSRSGCMCRAQACSGASFTLVNRCLMHLFGWPGGWLPGGYAPFRRGMW
ncbi:hypothetical protein BJA5080_07089 [Bradyrhizobium diazoefficiens SEMIA 5080]|uniref:Uncharacterized protein n=1 Tax=Bradyrhizobium diazoefficiens SEMIA 5080 TaxID=754504 RepID=A0A837CNN4_9BRAD|nr:hypothetical protein BJA5080_07089 [Bradyrhizobium diazoefficiens SEMIA 5080]